MSNKRFNRRMSQINPLATPGIVRVHTQDALPTSLEEGLALKEEGQAAATLAHVSWHVQALNWITAKPWGATFTADDLIEDLGLPTHQIGTNHNNAVGALFSAARVGHLIQSTGRYVQSTRKSNHAAVIVVWRRSSQHHG